MTKESARELAHFLELTTKALGALAKKVDRLERATNSRGFFGGAPMEHLVGQLESSQRRLTTLLERESRQ